MKNKILTKTIITLIIITLALAIMLPISYSLSAASANPKIIEHKKIIEITTPEPVIETHMGYHVAKAKGYDFMIEPSVPMLPMKTVSLVIPKDAEIKSIKIKSSTKNKLQGNYDIMPVQEQVPISRNTPVAFTEKNPSIYSSSNQYPGKLIEYASEGNLRNYRILSINVYPMQYNPTGKKLTYYNNIEIEVIYTAPPAKTEKTEEDEFARMVKKMVENPQDVETMPAETAEATSAVLPTLDAEYVIITDSTFESEFQVLANHKFNKGLSTEVVTLLWITNNYNGADTQEKIRNFIIDAKNTWGTTWILLGGDTDVIPHRMAYSDFYSEYIPADLYYSDLNGNWDYDGDFIYGELTDNIDMYPDVFVGRAPVNTLEEAQTFVSKTIAYEQGPSGYETTALFMAEYLDRRTDGAVTKDMIDTESIPEYFTVTKLYESLGNLNQDSAMTEMNKGYGIINHIGHANQYVLGIGPSALYNSNMDSLTNTQTSIFYSIGCWSNALDYDSIAEHFVLNSNGGGIAYIGNSRYGWYWPRNPGYGTSDRYDREFFNSLFNKNLNNIGETLADSKAVYIPSSQSANSYRYIQYALNLLGDPETHIWTSSEPRPAELSVVVTSPSTVNVGYSFTVSATVSNSGDETATGVGATITLPIGLSTTDPMTTTAEDILGGDSATVSWNVNADTKGPYTITVDAAATNADPASGTTTLEVVEPDTTPPVFFNIQSNPSSTTATITWTTDENADSNVDYGTSSNVYTDTENDASLVTIHSITLTGLLPETIYYYIVESTDASDNTAQSIEHTFTTTEQPTNTMHIANIDMSLKTAGPNKNGIALVTVVDENGATVAGATVYGTWSGLTEDTDSGLTDAIGQVSLSSDKVKNAPSGEIFTFTVDNIILSGWTYDSSANKETSDSITV